MNIANQKTRKGQCFYRLKKILFARIFKITLPHRYLGWGFVVFLGIWLMIPLQSRAERAVKQFIDLESHFAKVELEQAIKEGWLNGFSNPDGTFFVFPNQPITRAQWVALLFNAGIYEKQEVKGFDIENNTDDNFFADVPKDAWYYSFVRQAKDLKITNGYPDGTFRPLSPVTRAEMAIFLSKIIEDHSEDVRKNSFSEEFQETTIKTFPDVLENDWFYESVSKTKRAGWMNGFPDGRFMPYELATRAQGVIVLQKVRGVLESHRPKTEFVAVTQPDIQIKELEVYQEKPENEANIPEIVDDKKNEKNVVNLGKNEANENEANENEADENEANENEANENEANENEANENEAGENEAGENGANENEAGKNEAGENEATKQLQKEIVDENPNQHIPPKITFLKPFNNTKTTMNTTNDALNVQFSVDGNPLFSIYYELFVDEGEGTFKQMIQRGTPKTLAKSKKGFEEHFRFEIELSDLAGKKVNVHIHVKDKYGNTNTQPFEVQNTQDQNDDGITDYDKKRMGLSLKETDSDTDGLTDFQEVNIFGWKMSPRFYSSVGNGLPDGELDYDGDGLTNVEEISRYKTDPLKADTDGDGIPDGVEVNEYETNPLKRVSNRNRRTDFFNVKAGDIQNKKKSQSREKTPKNPPLLYETTDFKANPIESEDTPVELVLRIQYLLNRLLESKGKYEYTLRYTGVWDVYTQNALVQIFATSKLNDITYKDMNKRVDRLEETQDTFSPKRYYVGFDPTSSIEGVAFIKKRLEQWRETKVPEFHALYTLPTLYEEDGSITGIFDRKTVAYVKLFQQHHGLQGTGYINDATMERLLEATTQDEIESVFVKDDYFVIDGFGEFSFFRYHEDGESDLKPIYYPQTYGVWFKEPYYAILRGVEQRGRNIASSGCGPAAMAMIVATLQDEQVTPSTIAKFSMDRDYMTPYDGTEGRLYPAVSDHYQLKHMFTTRVSEVMHYLEKETHLAIASIGAGHFTDGGHVVTLTGVIQLPGESFKRIVMYDPDTANQNYGSDGAVIRSTKPGIVYVDPQVLQREMAIGFWLVWK